MIINSTAIIEMKSNQVIKSALKMLRRKRRALKNKETINKKKANTKIKKDKLCKITKKIFKDLSNYKMKKIKIKKELKNMRVIKTIHIQMMKSKTKKAHRINLIYQERENLEANLKPNQLLNKED